MKLINLTNKKLINLLIVFLLVGSNIFSYKNFGKNLQVNKVNDNSSVYAASDAVDLLINISKKVCTKATSSQVSSNDFDGIITDCLNNLKNKAVTFDNNLKNFWNIVTDYVKNKTDDTKKKIDQSLIEGLHMLVKNDRVKISAHHGSSCNNMIVIGKWNQSDVISEIEAFLKKFNFNSNVGKKPFISSMIGPHRNLADPGFFTKLNGGDQDAKTTTTK